MRHLLVIRFPGTRGEIIACREPSTSLHGDALREANRISALHPHSVVMDTATGFAVYSSNLSTTYATVEPCPSSVD